MIDEQMRGLIMKEVQRQIEPLAGAVEDVKKQNTAQSSKLADIDAWRRGLWGNGSGTPGYLERARAEDKTKYDQLLASVNALTLADQRQQGRDELLRELETNRIRLEQLSDTKKTGRLTRLHIWLAIASSFTGAWLLTLLRPILHTIIQQILQQ